MKQHITVEQLNELSEKGNEIFRKWGKPEVGDWFLPGSKNWPPNKETLIEDLGGTIGFNVSYSKNGKNTACILLSIGQMIKFLVDHKWIKSDVEIFTVGELDPAFEWKDNLCDTLWEEVKVILNKV